MGTGPCLGKGTGQSLRGGAPREVQGRQCEGSGAGPGIGMALCGGNSVWEGRAVLQQMAWWAGSFLSAGTAGTESCREGPWVSHGDPGCSRSPGARRGFRLDVYPQPRFTLNFQGCLWINRKGTWMEIFLAPRVGLPTSKEGSTVQTIWYQKLHFYTSDS